MVQRKWLVVAALLVAAALGWWLAPRPDLWRGVSFSRCYYDRDGRLLRVTLADDRRYRVYTPLAEISPLAVEAALLHEDRWFAWHPGVNPIALGRAAVNELGGFHRRVGASTVSMQLARLRWRLHTRAAGGKVAQLARAAQIELFHSKRAILEAYLNQIPYGKNIEGIGAASLVYYGKPARELTLAEALTLAVIPQSPARRAPRAGNVELARARGRLFARWVKRHPRDAGYGPTLDMAWPARAPRDLPFHAPHFTDWLERTNRAPRLTTTLSLPAQQIVERAVAAHVGRQRANGVRNAAALVVDTDTLGVVAAVGSADWFDAGIAGQVNGLLMRRSPGSTLKPLLYALALDEGLIQPLTLLRDEPGGFGDYNPENYDRAFAGPVHAAAALRQSRNVPAVWLLSKLRKKTLHGLLREAGVRHLRPESHYGLTLALGSAEVSPVELAQLYAMLANGGVFRPLTLAAPADRAGAVVDAAPRLLSPEACFLVLDMLRETARPDAMRGGGARARGGGVAWKTGTSWSYRDAWAVAVFDHYALVVWVGDFSGGSDGQFVGRRAAAPLLFNIIDALRAREPAVAGPAAWENPRGLNLARVDLCAVSGAPARRHCPQTVKGWFIPGVSPIAPCAVHQVVWINPRTGLRVTDGAAVAGARAEVYEIWPADLLASFRRAGLPRRQPPAFEGRRAAAATASAVEPRGPEIKSPREHLTYVLPLAGPAPPIMLQATADADAEELYWFAGAVFIGRCRAGETLAWTPSAGVHQLTVTDEHGRAASRQVTVEAGR
ncbi:MAG: penicillin-binding protein 1C [Verrucomicrobiales bacterium]|nr:penicillin-binding protein 1C [Verrucomicrobiales bacterium]